MSKNTENTILDLLSKYEISVNTLIYASKVDSYIGYDLREYNANKISKTIFNLLDNNFCFVYNFNNEISQEINITEQAINYYKKNKFFDFHIYDNIKLTPKGSNLWEQIFQPNWFNYIDVYYEDKSYTEPVRIELISMNKCLLLEICQNLNQENLIIEALDEWEICYWKTITDIPIFKYSYIAESIEEKMLIDDIWQNLHTYKDKFCKKTRGFF